MNVGFREWGAASSFGEAAGELSTEISFLGSCNTGQAGYVTD